MCASPGISVCWKHRQLRSNAAHGIRLPCRCHSYLLARSQQLELVYPGTLAAQDSLNHVSRDGIMAVEVC